jgi:hypothetical protein
VHTISCVPGFDHVVKVSSEKPVPCQSKGLATLPFPGRKNAADGRLRTSEQLTAIREDGQPMRLTLQRELSFLVGLDFTPQKP